MRRVVAADRSLTRASGNQNGGAWALADEVHRRRLTHSLAFGALILALAFPVTFETNLTMQALSQLFLEDLTHEFGDALAETLGTLFQRRAQFFTGADR